MNDCVGRTVLLRVYSNHLFPPAGSAFFTRSDEAAFQQPEEGKSHLPLQLRRFVTRMIRSTFDRMRFRSTELSHVPQSALGCRHSGSCGALHINTLEPRRLIFDHPFLLALKEKEATIPYFLAWIANADLMDPAK